MRISQQSWTINRGLTSYGLRRAALLNLQGSPTLPGLLVYRFKDLLEDPGKKDTYWSAYKVAPYVDIPRYRADVVKGSRWVAIGAKGTGLEDILSLRFTIYAGG